MNSIRESLVEHLSLRGKSLHSLFGDSDDVQQKKKSSQKSLKPFLFPLQVELAGKGFCATYLSGCGQNATETAEQNGLSESLTSEKKSIT